LSFTDEPISAVYDTVKDQKVEGENLMDDVVQQGALFDKLNKSGQNVINSLDEGPDKDELVKRLDELNNEWEGVKKEANERKMKIDKVYPLAEEYKTKVDDFAPWLENAEKKIGDIEPGAVKKAEAGQELEKLKVCTHWPDLYHKQTIKTTLWGEGERGICLIDFINLTS
jgi:DNA repair ATPase RecN